MRTSRLTVLILAFIAYVAAVLVAVLLARQGGCDRNPPPDDDEPVPACEPGDKECYGADPTGRPAA